MKTVAFTQYPRPSAFPQKNSDKPRLKKIKIMGYSIRTNRFRYTEWVRFNTTTCLPNWHESIVAELYDHINDPDENENLIDIPGLNVMKSILRKRLKLGWRGNV